MSILLKTDEEEVENLNRSIASKEIGAVNKKLPKNKSSVLDGFTSKCYQTFIEALLPLILILFQNIRDRNLT